MSVIKNLLAVTGLTICGATLSGCSSKGTTDPNNSGEPKDWVISYDSSNHIITKNVTKSEADSFEKAVKQEIINRIHKYDLPTKKGPSQ